MNSVVTSTDSYITLLMSLANMSAITVFSAFLLTMARLIPTMVLAPFFGAKLIPTTVRIMFCICITSILLPQILMTAAHQKIIFDMVYIGLLIKELFIGFILAFLITIPFYIAQSSGSLIDHIRGSASLQVTDPTTSTQTGPVGILYNYTLIAIFFIIGGPFLYIDAISKSFVLIPVTEVLNPIFFSLQIDFWKKLIGLLSYIFSIAIQLGAPSIIGVLMAEMFLGIANRLAPQVQIVFLGISLKSWVGLGLLACAWYFIMQELGKESTLWLKSIDELIEKAALLKPK
jgi:type III secretion protein T